MSSTPPILAAPRPSPHFPTTADSVLFKKLPKASRGGGRGGGNGEKRGNNNNNVNNVGGGGGNSDEDKERDNVRGESVIGGFKESWADEVGGDDRAGGRQGREEGNGSEGNGNDVTFEEDEDYGYEEDLEEEVGGTQIQAEEEEDIDIKAKVEAEVEAIQVQAGLEELETLEEEAEEEAELAEIDMMEQSGSGVVGGIEEETVKAEGVPWSDERLHAKKYKTLAFRSCLLNLLSNDLKLPNGWSQLPCPTTPSPTTPANNLNQEKKEAAEIDGARDPVIVSATWIDTQGKKKKFGADSLGIHKVSGSLTNAVFFVSCPEVEVEVAVGGPYSQPGENQDKDGIQVGGMMGSSGELEAGTTTITATEEWGTALWSAKKKRELGLRTNSEDDSNGVNSTTSTPRASSPASINGNYNNSNKNDNTHVVPPSTPKPSSSQSHLLPSTNASKPNTNTFTLSPPTLLLRIYGPSSSSLISRNSELHILHTLSSVHNIGPKLLGTFRNGRVEEYLSSRALKKEEMRDGRVGRWVARRMRELHCVEVGVLARAGKWMGVKDKAKLDGGGGASEGREGHLGSAVAGDGDESSREREKFRRFSSSGGGPPVAMSSVFAATERKRASSLERNSSGTRPGIAPVQNGVNTASGANNSQSLSTTTTTNSYPPTYTSQQTASPSLIHRPSYYSPYVSASASACYSPYAFSSGSSSASSVSTLHADDFDLEHSGSIYYDGPAGSASGRGSTSDSLSGSAYQSPIDTPAGGSIHDAPPTSLANSITSNNNNNDESALMEKEVTPIDSAEPKTGLLTEGRAIAKKRSSSRLWKKNRGGSGDSTSASGGTTSAPRRSSTGGSVGSRSRSGTVGSAGKLSPLISATSGSYHRHRGKDRDKDKDGDKENKLPLGIWENVTKWTKEASRVLGAMDSVMGLRKGQQQQQQQQSSKSLMSSKTTVTVPQSEEKGNQAEIELESEESYVWPLSSPDALLRLRDEIDLPRFVKEIKRYRTWVRNWEKENGKSKRVFAHNDTQYGNLLLLTRAQENKSAPPSETPPNSTYTYSSSIQVLPWLRAPHEMIVVVDFEYSSPNPRAFDIGNHFQEWRANYHHETMSHSLKFHGDFPTLAERQRFYRAYIGCDGMWDEAGIVDPVRRREMEREWREKQERGRKGNGGETVNEEDEKKVFDPEEPDPDPRVRRLEAEVEVWAPASHIWWSIWGIVQARDEVLSKLDRWTLPLRDPDSITTSTMTDEAEEPAEFDYLSYALGRIRLFRQDMERLGI